MDKMMIIVGVVGIFCSVFAIITMAISMMGKGNWGMVIACLAALSTILFLTLLGIEHHDDFWKGRS